MDEKQRPRVSAGASYAATVDLAIHLESLTWDRMYNFLTANSILVLAWATIFAADGDPSVAKSVVLGGICSLGAATGIAWAALGMRGRRLHDWYHDLGASGYEVSPAIAFEAGSELGPLTGASDYTRLGPFSWAGSWYVLTLVPLAFAVLHALMMWACNGCIAAFALAVPIALFAAQLRRILKESDV